MKVIDGFLFFNEFDMLKLRLEYLSDIVDEFLICESNCTFSGKSKPYYLDEYIDKIPEDIRKKIVRIKYEPDISNVKFPSPEILNRDDPDVAKHGSEYWKIEHGQRKEITNYLKNYDLNDLFILSDVDEIPRKEVIENFSSGTYEQDFCYAAKSEMFYYNFNTILPHYWAGTVFTSVKNAIQKGCDFLREERYNMRLIQNGGWHFSYFGDVEKIKTKLQSFSHQEYNKEPYTTEVNISESIKNKKDLFQRGYDFKQYSFSLYPDNLKQLIIKIFSKQFYTMEETNMNTNKKSGATETCYHYLHEHYQFPENVFVSHLPEELKKSNHPYKILWAHHAYDQPVFLNFDHNIVNHIVTPSQWSKEQFIKYLNVPEYKITVIPNGVADIFTHSTQKTKTMIFTSIPYKGLEVLSKVIPMIHQVHPDTKFKIFSSMSLYGPSNDPFIELYEHLKTLPNVEYSPAIDREELVKHYQESAFFIHPNIWEETFCVSMTEAMRCGAYPIITDIGALAEVAGEKNATVVPIEGENTSKGWKVTENFLVNFSNACCLALEYYDKEPKFYQEVSKIISDYVTEKYDWKNIAQQWKSLIANIGENQISSPVYYCMINTYNTERYTDLAISTFFKNTQLKDNDRFFLIDNDGKYKLKQNFSDITVISNNQPRYFAKNMNHVMKLAFHDKADFIGLNNDIVFTENWNKNFGSSKCISVPLCNQMFIGEYGGLKIKSVMDIEEFGDKEEELNSFAKNIDPQKIKGTPSLIAFYCFHIPHEIISKVGFFDEEFSRGGDDVDYRLRASQLGYEVTVNTSSYLLHFCGKSSWRSGEDRQKTLEKEQECYDHFSKKWGRELANDLLAASSV